MARRGGHGKGLYSGIRTYNKLMEAQARRHDQRDYRGVYVEGRKAWTSESLPVRAILYSRPLERSQHPERDTVDLLLHVTKNPKPYRLRLTSLRPDELEVLKQIFDQAFDMARPIVEANYASDLRHYEATGVATYSMYRDENPRVVTQADVKKGMVERDLLSLQRDTGLDSADQAADEPDDDSGE